MQFDDCPSFDIACGHSTVSASVSNSRLCLFSMYACSPPHLCVVAKCGSVLVMGADSVWAAPTLTVNMKVRTDPRQEDLSLLARPPSGGRESEFHYHGESGIGSLPP